jgi:CheY-like chemotaxis protein
VIVGTSKKKPLHGTLPESGFFAPHSVSSPREILGQSADCEADVVDVVGTLRVPADSGGNVVEIEVVAAAPGDVVTRARGVAVHSGVDFNYERFHISSIFHPQFVTKHRSCASDLKNDAETAAPEGTEGMTKEKILVVDADKKTFDGVEILAEKGGIEACYATSAEEAWSFLIEGGVSLMLINPSIPGVNGYTLASMAKNLYSDVTVVMMTERVTKLCAANDWGSRTLAKADKTSRILDALLPRGKEEKRREVPL